MISIHVTYASAGAENINNAIMDIVKRSEELDHLFINCGHVILKTCNRFEIYFGSDDLELIMSLRSFTDGKKEAFVLSGQESIEHLCRVVCGLDSMMVGEDQIQGQVKEAYSKAAVEGHVSGLTRIFERALEIGKRVRTETKLNQGAVSVGSAAVRLAISKLGTLENKTVTVFGAGNVAETIVSSLSGMNVNSIFISNRTHEHAEQLAERLNGKAVHREDLRQVLSESDLLIVATSAPHILIDKERIAPSVGNRKLMIIDVSVPKNVDDDVRELDNVHLESMEGLQTIAEENLRKRRSEIPKAEKIIREGVNSILAEMSEKEADLLIRCINEKISAIREEELCKAKQKAASSNVNEVFDDFSRVLVSRIFADTYESLKKASRDGRSDVMDIVTDIFGLEVKQ
jgi:glutamyl-tRNA reductase